MMTSARKSATLSRFKNIVRGSAAPREALGIARAMLSPGEYASAQAWLATVRHAGQNKVTPEVRPTLSSLYPWDPLPALPIIREARWSSELLRRQANQLDWFVGRSEAYERQILSGALGECAILLDEIDEQVGASLWSIEQRLAILQLGEGLASQKAFASKVYEARRGRYDYVAFLTYYISQRNEENTSGELFQYRLERLIEEWPKPLATYARYRLLGRPPGDDHQRATLLAFEASANVVDLYVTFLDLAPGLLCGDATLAAAVRRECQLLCEAVRDPRLLRLSRLSNGSVSAECGLLRDLGADNAFAAGNYAEAVGEATRILEDVPDDVSTLVRGSMARAETNAQQADPKDGLHISDWVYDVVQGGENAATAAASLAKASLNFRLNAFAPVLETHLTWLAGPAELGSALADKAIGSSRFIELMRRSFRALNGYEASVAGTYGPQLAVVAEFGLEDATANVDGLSQEGRMLLAARRELAAGQYADALSAASQLRVIPVRWTRRPATRIAATSLLGLGRIGDLATLLVDVALRERSLLDLEMLKICCEQLDKTQRKEHAARIEVPIVLDLYLRDTGVRRNNVRAYAYDDFLRAHNISMPSKLGLLRNVVDCDKLVYFLRFVAVSEVMQVITRSFSGTNEVRAERLRVLGVLCELDPERCDLYQAEQEDLRSAMRIEQAVRSAEESRIDVDRTGLIHWAERNLSEGFARYKALQGTGIASLQGVANDGAPGVSQQASGVDDRKALFSELINALWHQVLRNPTLGFDYFLSIRIRHGTLIGQLRRPLEDEHVITKRATSSNGYLQNEFWLNALSGVEGKALGAINRRLAKLSADYGELTERFKNDLLQIQSRAKPDGLFKLLDPTLVTALRGIESLVGQDTTFEQFLGMFFSVFWRVLELELGNVRLYLENVFKPTVSRMLQSAETDIGALGLGSEVAELRNALRRASTNAYNAIEHVKSWFYPPKDAPPSRFTLRDLIAISLHAVQNAHPDFSPNLATQTSSSDFMIGGLLYFYDVFLIVFNNIREHGTPLKPDVEIAVVDDGEVLMCRVRNSTSASRRGRALKKLQDIRQRIDSNDYSSVVALEGGTGIIKLHSLIGEDSSIFDFGFDDAGWFFLEFGIRWDRRERAG